MQIEIPKINSEWYHKGTDKKYTVIVVANENATKKDYPIIVVYRDDNDNIWAKDLKRFMLSMSFYDREGRGQFPISHNVVEQINDNVAM